MKVAREERRGNDEKVVCGLSVVDTSVGELNFTCLLSKATANAIVNLLCADLEIGDLLES